MTVRKPTGFEHPAYRLFLPLDADPPVMASAQKLNASLVALLIAMVDWRFASAAILLRAEFATAFAPLSHMLMNGFFLSQGLDIADSSVTGAR